MKAQEHARVCIEKIGVNKDDVVKVMRGDFSVTDDKIEVRIIIDENSAVIYIRTREKLFRSSVSFANYCSLAFRLNLVNLMYF